MKNRKSLVLLVSLLMLVSVFCQAVGAAGIPDPPEEFYVYDEANVISSATEKHIADTNDLLFFSTKAQIVIAAVKTTGDMTIRDYAGEMFTKWKIGDSNLNNGVLVLMAIEDDDYWVTQGSGIESQLTSGDIKVMLDNLLEPSFAAKNYDKGASALFDGLVSTFESIYDVNLEEVVLPEGGIDPNGKVEAKADGKIVGSILTGFIIVVVIVLFIIVITMVVRGMSAGGRGYRRPTVHIPPGQKRPPERRQPPRLGAPGNPGTGPRPGGMNRPMGNRPGSSSPRPSGTGPRPGGNTNRPAGYPSSGARRTGSGTTRSGGAERR